MTMSSNNVTHTYNFKKSTDMSHWYKIVLKSDNDDLMLIEKKKIKYYL